MSARNNNTIKCDTQGCLCKVQAVCFKCSKMYCFQCSMFHAQYNAGKNHTILEIEYAYRNIEKTTGDLLLRIRQIRAEGERYNKIDTEYYNEKLHPERFQQQLDEITFMKKYTLKVVEKFYSEISLYLVNMWEFYLKKYSNLDYTLYQLTLLYTKLKPYHNPKGVAHDELIKGFMREDFESRVAQFREKLLNRRYTLKSIPKCPSVRIDDRVLVYLSEVLCSSISTINYTSLYQKYSYIFRINQPNSLAYKVKYLPIFPIKKPHCYLFDLKNRSYEIQYFNNLDYLPEYPKTIVIPNGDIHIVGGIKKKYQLMNTHLVFRSSSSEVFKLADLPYAINPSNSLLYHSKHIYLIGGMLEKHEWSKRCIKYSLYAKYWRYINSMASPKPHQSAAVFQDSIYCFGIPNNKKINIEKYDIYKDYWYSIAIRNFLSNPFNFASGFTTVQLNEGEILFLGGKKFLENVVNNRRSTDRYLTPNIYVFRPENNSFVQMGRLYPCLGVQYGYFNPIVYGGSIYFCEYLLSKNNPIARWYDNLHVLQLTTDGAIESVAILNEY